MRTCPEPPQVSQAAAELPAGLTVRDYAYWGKNYAAVSDRFQEWLLMGGKH